MYSIGFQQSNDKQEPRGAFNVDDEGNLQLVGDADVSKYDANNPLLKVARDQLLSLLQTLFNSFSEQFKRYTDIYSDGFDSVRTNHHHN